MKAKLLNKWKDKLPDAEKGQNSFLYFDVATNTNVKIDVEFQSKSSSKKPFTIKLANNYAKDTESFYLEIDINLVS